MFKSVLLASSVLFLGQAALALEVTKKDQYELFLFHMKTADEFCKKTAFEQIEKDVVGLSGVDITAPDYWESEIGNVAVLSYFNMHFRSEYGDKIGHMTCVVPKSGTPKAEVTLSFESGGLSGFRRGINPKAEPQDNSRTMVTYIGPSI